LAPTHVGKESLDTVVGAVEVRVDHRVIIVGGEDFEGAARCIGAGGVDQHVDVAEFLQHLLSGAGDRGGVRHVDHESGEAVRRVAGESDGLVESLLAAAEACDFPSGPGQSQCDRASDSAAGAGDDCCVVHAAVVPQESRRRQAGGGDINI
jgi:hypothetical protein